MYGNIIIRNESAARICTVEMAYSNTQFGRKTIVPTILLSMGSLNNTGALLASAGYIQKDDEYENEEITDELKLAKLCFYSSTSNKSWEVSLPKGVNILAITLGYHWIAVATSEKFIRFLSPNGIDTNIIGFNNPIVGMCSYESHLAVFYHDSYPFSGNQFLKVKVINVTSFRSVLDIPVCLSHNSELKWYGFSEEGILYTQDSSYKLWGLYNSDFWSPVYDGSKLTNMFVIGVSETTIVYIKKQSDEEDINPYIDLTPYNAQFKPPLLNSSCENLYLASMRSEQEKLRSLYWGHMKNELTDGLADLLDCNPMEHNRSSIKDPNQLKKIVMNAEKERTDLIR